MMSKWYVIFILETTAKIFSLSIEAIYILSSFTIETFEKITHSSTIIM